MEPAVVLCRGESSRRKIFLFTSKKKSLRSHGSLLRKRKAFLISGGKLKKGPSLTPSINIRECRRKLPRALASVRGFFDTK